IFEVPPLAVPAGDTVSAQEMRSMASIELFVARAVAANAYFTISDAELPVVAKVCRQLDGLPLAIEMVAGWAAVLGIHALDSEFEGPATIWMRADHAKPARHATLSAALAWSYDLLPAAEKNVLRRLAVFADSFTLFAVKVVVCDDGITQSEMPGY